MYEKTSSGACDLQGKGFLGTEGHAVTVGDQTGIVVGVHETGVVIAFEDGSRTSLSATDGQTVCACTLVDAK